MRIAMICTEKLPVPPVQGGAVQTYIDAVARILAQRHSVTVFCIVDKDLPNTQVEGNLRFIRISDATSKEAYIQAVCEELEGKRFDVIVVFNRPLWVLPVRQAAPKSHIVLSMHNDMFHPEKVTQRQGVACLTEVDAVVTVSRYIGRTVSRRYPEFTAKICPIYSGVDLQQFVPAWSPEGARLRKEIREKLGIGEGPVILCVGRLSVKKGPHVIVRAMPRILRQHPDAKLILVGSKWYGDQRPDPYVRWIWRIARPFKEHVVFTGFVLPRDVHHLYSAADVFVCASQWQEPLARVHYEAMAAGLPIVTTPRGGNPEVVRGQNNGLVLRRWRSPISIAKAILYYLNDESRRREAGQVGRALAEQRYSWKRVAEELNVLFHHIVYSSADQLGHGSPRMGA